MSFTSDEKMLLKMLVKKELESLKDEGKVALLQEDYPDFIAGEEKYEMFLERLLKKL